MIEQIKAQCPRVYPQLVLFLESKYQINPETLDKKISDVFWIGPLLDFVFEEGLDFGVASADTQVIQHELFLAIKQLDEWSTHYS